MAVFLEPDTVWHFINDITTHQISYRDNCEKVNSVTRLFTCFFFSASNILRPIYLEIVNLSFLYIE